MNKERGLKILILIMVVALGLGEWIKVAEGAITSQIEVKGEEFKGLSKSEAERVIKIWRVIGDQEIVNWDGKEWLAKTEDQKRETIEKVCEAWRKAGYQNIESVKYFVEDIDKCYNHHRQKESREGLKEKAGLVVSLSAFFAGMEDW